MPIYPSIPDIQRWSAEAADIFRSIMPPMQPISKLYPDVHIATEDSFHEMRAELLLKTGCKHTEEPEASIMEYIHGDKGYAILIRQELLPDKNSEHFCWFFWHELGHFYAINSELTDLHRYSDPGVVDDSRIIEFNRSGPVLGMSDERLRQEGYWFWQEFIAETISKYVSFVHRSTTRSYHPEDIDWHPEVWSPIIDKLLFLLDSTLAHFNYTIDEYALAHYFANLLMDDFIVLYVKAAEAGKLKVYDNDPKKPHQKKEYMPIVYPKEPIEPTCISDIETKEYQEPLWKMKAILDDQLTKEHFWMIDEDFLLNVGRCIGEMMFIKVIEMSAGKG